MKTSNKFLILITIVIIGFMVIYDNDLKAEYLKGDFKNPFRDLQKVAIDGFTNVDHRSADVIDASVEYGPEYSIWVNKNLKDRVQITKQGKTLVIKFIGRPEDRLYFSPGVTITSPRLDSITTTANAEPLKDLKEKGITGDVDIIGFNQSKMVLKANRFTQIELKNNKIENMQAVIGSNLMGVGSLNINSSNQIKLANIKVNGTSELKMTNPNITTLEHSFSDSASLILSGSALRLLNK